MIFTPKKSFSFPKRAKVIYQLAARRINFTSLYPEESEGVPSHSETSSAIINDYFNINLKNTINNIWRGVEKRVSLFFIEERQGRKELLKQMTIMRREKAELRKHISKVENIPYMAKVCRAKVTNFLESDENFARRTVSPDKVSQNNLITICLNDLFPF